MLVNPGLAINIVRLGIHQSMELSVLTFGTACGLGLGSVGDVFTAALRAGPGVDKGHLSMGKMDSEMRAQP